MPATRTDLSIEQGVTYAHGWLVTYNGTPINATWTARSQARVSTDSAAVLYEFACSVDAAGAVVLAVDDTDSAAWVWRRAVYDVEVVNLDSTVVLRVAMGFVTVSPEVTR